MAIDRFAAGEDDGTDETAGRGQWLTYRYRLGGGTATGAAGTIKAPSFLSAARRLLTRRLAGHLGSSPAYLRLRAAGEDEVLLRVTPAAPEGASEAPRVEVVPRDTYAFDGADPAADSDRAGRAFLETRWDSSP